MTNILKKLFCRHIFRDTGRETLRVVLGATYRECEVIAVSRQCVKCGYQTVGEEYAPRLYEPAAAQ